MSSNINLIEVTNLSYKELITLIDKDPVSHLEEVPFGNFQLELDLVDEVYDYSEQAGYCRSYIVSVNGNYAGYILLMASEMIHHRGQMQAVADSFYIVPKYRSSGAFTTLLTYVENDLRSNGIRFLTVGLNPNMPHVHKMQKFINDKGYVHTEAYYTKEL
jgi:GNAT superfamily N-acetyltransferase